MLMNLVGLAQLESRLSPNRAAGWLNLILSHPSATQETRQRAEELCAKQQQHIQAGTPYQSLEEVVDAILK